MKYMLDTNICIYVRKHHPISVVRKFETVHARDTAISSVVLSELAYGVYNSQQVEKNMISLIKLVSPISVLPYDEAAAFIYGEIYADLKKTGKMIGQLDTMIAAHAISINATLITNNLKEFSRIKKLKCENWI